MTLKEINSFIRQIYEGGITTRSLNKPLSRKLFSETYKKLKSGVKLAFTGTKDPLYTELNDNIYIFSAAKTYTQVKDISSLIVDKETRLMRPYSEFKKLAKSKYDIYNVDYLKSEYETAVGQAQTAVKWQEIVKQSKLFPYLKREAVMDGITSPECVILNGIMAPVGDSFWATRSPLTHFNCRCIITQIDKYDDVSLSSGKEKAEAMDKTDHINPLFKGNPGIDKVVFNESHPYFDIEPKDKELAKRNFNL